MHSLLSPSLTLRFYSLPPGTHYSTFLIPLHTFRNKMLLQFSRISHMPPHLSLSPWTRSHLSYPATDATPHILPAKHRRSSSRQFFLTLPASRENRNSNQELPGGKNKKLHTPASPTTDSQKKHCLSHPTLNSQQLFLQSELLPDTSQAFWLSLHPAGPLLPHLIPLWAT